MYNKSINDDLVRIATLLSARRILRNQLPINGVIRDREWNLANASVVEEMSECWKRVKATLEILTDA